MKKILLIILLSLMALGMMAQNGNNVSGQITKFGQTLYYINNYYLDTVNFKTIVDKAIIAAIGELDPHSSFISSDDVKAMNEPLEGEFEGIGVEFAIIHDTLTVQAPVFGGPSEKVGILTGDKIVSVNGENIAGISLTNEMVFKYLRGAKGTKVDLGIVRKEERKLLIFTVVRDKIPLNSVDAVYQVEPGYLYIKLSRFASSSYDEMIQAMASVKGAIKGIILDLRGNSGGYLYSAIKIANEFLDKNNMIVYTQGRTVPDMKELADGNGKYKRGPLVLLVDENSASASEIVSGAVQDWDRGIIIGRRTFGKGLVQQAMPLSDGSQLRLTIAKYHTPSGRVIQSPYKNGKSQEYYLDFYKRYAHGESFSKDSIHFPDSLKYKTLRLKRTVFGGGGIMPDIFVPADTSYYSDYYASLLRRGVVIEYMNDQIDKNRKVWSVYSSFEKFDKHFIITDDMFNGLVDAAKKKGIEPDEAQIAISKNVLKIYMKALVASSIVGRDAFYRILHKYDDPVFIKTMEVLKNWEKYGF